MASSFCCFRYLFSIFLNRRYLSCLCIKNMEKRRKYLEIGMLGTSMQIEDDKIAILRKRSDEPSN